MKQEQTAMLRIPRREPFTAASLTGRRYDSGTGLDTGRLDGPDLQKWRQDCLHIDYAVWSYGTPIAWHSPRGWYEVGQGFSRTTARHKGIVARALAFDARRREEGRQTL